MKIWGGINPGSCLMTPLCLNDTKRVIDLGMISPSYTICWMIWIRWTFCDEKCNEQNLLLYSHYITHSKTWIAAYDPSSTTSPTIIIVRRGPDRSLKHRSIGFNQVSQYLNCHVTASTQITKTSSNIGAM